METTFLEMRCKEVINVCDGRLLGRICDVVFDVRTSRILGFVVPGCRGGFFRFFKSSPEVFVPYCNICKIGEDVILVEVYDLPPDGRCRICKDGRQCATCNTDGGKTNKKQKGKNYAEGYINAEDGAEGYMQGSRTQNGCMPGGYAGGMSSQSGGYADYNGNRKNGSAMQGSGGYQQAYMQDAGGYRQVYPQNENSAEDNFVN